MNKFVAFGSATEDSFVDERPVNDLIATEPPVNMRAKPFAGPLDDGCDEARSELSSSKFSLLDLLTWVVLSTVD